MQTKLKNINIHTGFAIVIALIVLLSRILFLDVAAGNDESMYALLGSKTLEGNALYTTFYEMKPPFLFYNYALIAIFVKNSVIALHVAALILSLINSSWIYFLTKELIDEKKSAVASLLFFTLSSSPYLVGTYLVSEHITLFFLLSAMLILLVKSNNVYTSLGVSGALFAISVLTKQSGVFFGPVFLLMLYFLKEEISYVKKLSYFSFGGIAIVLLTSLMLYSTRSLEDAFYFLFTHSQKYTSSLSIDIGLQSLSYFSQVFIKNHWLPIFLALLGIGTLIKQGLKSQHYIIFLFLFMGILSIFPGFRFYYQYWILLIPSIAILGSMGLTFIRDEKSYQWITLGSIGLHIFFNLSSYFPIDKDKLINAIYPGQYFKEIKLLSLKLKRQMNKEDQILVLGATPQVYMYTDRSPITRHIWTPMISYPNDRCKQYREELIATYEEVKPKYIFFSYAPIHWTLTTDLSDEIYRYMYNQVSSNYQKIMAIDLKTGQIFGDDTVLSFEEKNNTIFIYKLAE